MSQNIAGKIIGTLMGRKLYPRAHDKRLPHNHPSLRGPKQAFFKAAAKNFILLQVLFFGLFAYIFGALFQEIGHIHNLRVLFVDYDGGAIGASFRDAYKSLQGDSFPTLIERTGSDFPDSSDLRNEVCDTRYWAALYIPSGASNKVQAAVLKPTTDYNKDEIVSYVWNEARYSAIIDSAISADLVALSSAARIQYANRNWSEVVQTPSATSFSIFGDPWNLNSINIQPTTQGSRLIYNTLVIILILIQEFFYLGSINALYEAFKIYSRLEPHHIIVFRNVLSAAYTLLGSLSTAGAIWAFRGEWKVNGDQFVLTWLILWLFAHVNFLTLDVFTVWIPAPYVPMALITWIVFNVTSILVPFDLSPAFYRWAYAMPAHEVYQILIDIWSGGCNPQLHYALPVLFALELSGLFLSALGVHRRSHYAILKEETEASAFQSRINAALAFEREKREGEELKHKQTNAPRISSESDNNGVAETSDAADVEKEREGLSGAIRKEYKLEKAQSKRSQSVDFGPSFGFNFGTSNES
jgi:Protein of unknown function (DUF3533)